MAEESVHIYDEKSYEDYYEATGPITFNPNFTLEDSVTAYTDGLKDQRFIPLEVILVISVVGIFLNLLNIFVYTRKSMISSINILLASFEAANVIFFVSFIMQSVEYIQPKGYVFSGHWAAVSRTYPVIRLAAACTSNWLAVTIGFWRCIAIGFPLKSHFCLTRKTAIIAIVVVITSSLLLAIPDLLLTDTQQVTAHVYDPQDIIINNLTLYETTQNEAYDPDVLFMAHNSATLVFTFVPCVLLILATGYLVYCLCRASRKRKLMRICEESMQSLKEQRLTAMLLVVLISFVISYLPDATCVVILMVHFKQFANEEITWNPSGVCKTMIMDGVYPILSNTLTFFVYYFMSENFRNTFRGILGNVLPRRKSTVESTTSTIALKAETAL